MNDIGFRVFLKESRRYKNDSVVDTIRGYAKKAELILDTELDIVVANDLIMYNSLLKLSTREKVNNMQHAVRRYYVWKNQKEFPRMKDYETMQGMATK